MERHKKAVIGPISRVPCPWCGVKNDFSDVNEQFPLEGGCVVDCDDCQQESIVVQINRAPWIILKQKHT